MQKSAIGKIEKMQKSAIGKIEKMQKSAIGKIEKMQNKKTTLFLQNFHAFCLINYLYF